jgi:hypothetical protein
MKQTTYGLIHDDDDDDINIRTAAQAKSSEVGLSSQYSYITMTFCTELPLGQGSVKYLMSLKDLTPLDAGITEQLVQQANSNIKMNRLAQVVTIVFGECPSWPPRLSATLQTEPPQLSIV